MKKWSRRHFLIAMGVGVATLSGAGGILYANSTRFSGTVRHMASEEPIEGARVFVSTQYAMTDAEGRYTLSLPPGTYDVCVQAPRFIDMAQGLARLEQGQQVILDFEMIPLDPSPAEAEIIDAKMLARPEQSAEGLGSIGAAAISSVPNTLRVLMPDDSTVVMTMDQYLRGVIPHEVPAYWPTESIRAQAVAARSYAATSARHLDKGADVCTTTHCQMWKPTYYATTDHAVNHTHGVVGTYNNRIISAYFFGHCDGRTRNNEEVWTSGAPVPYCRSVQCSCGYTTMYGHGVGMCQYGTRTMAEWGHNYVQILKHYYTGIQVEAPAPGGISSHSLNPNGGDTNTLYTFEALYTNTLGDPPAVANVIIDEHANAMERVPGSYGGALYRLTTRLPAGQHNYRFYFDDGYGNVSRVPASGTLAGPGVTAAAAANPTPIPAASLPGGVLSRSITHATLKDWADGKYNGVYGAAADDGCLELNGGSTEGTYTSAQLTSPIAFQALAITWYGQTLGSSSIAIEARVRAPNGSWGAWRSMPVAEDEGMRATLCTSDLVFGQGVGVQYRATLRRPSAADSSPRLSSIRLLFLDGSAGPSAQTLREEAPISAALRPRVFSRADWGANESLMTWPPEYRKPRVVILHHTATSDGGVDPAAIVRTIYYYHAITREWGDIGYNFLVDHLGNIYEGRAGGPGVVGGHALQFNWGSIGVSLIGDYQTAAPPASMLNALTSLLGWLCTEHNISPVGRTYFIDRELHNILGHRDCASTVCPGNGVYNLLPNIRAQAQVGGGPGVRITSPSHGAAIRGVIHATVQTETSATSVDYYLAGESSPRATARSAPFSAWVSTAGLPDGTHTLRAVAHGPFGSVEDLIQVSVDNTPPTGSVQVITQLNSSSIELVVTSPDATAVQISENWVWEGESQAFRSGTARVVSDPDASSNRALGGNPALDAEGDWFGPYTCALPGGNYEVSYRLKTSDRATDEKLATLRVLDQQGRRIYSERSLHAGEFLQNNRYEEFGLELKYPSRAPTCATPNSGDGLEFLTHYYATGELYLDRITVFTAPRLMSKKISIRWDLPPVKAVCPMIVRIVDRVGNTTDLRVEIDLRRPPVWLRYDGHSAMVQDKLAGLDTESAEWSASRDGGRTWGPWQKLVLSAPYGTKDPVKLAAPAHAGPRVRYRIRDLTGLQTVVSDVQWLPWLSQRTK